MSHIKELTKDEYKMALKGDIGRQINWFAVVGYQDGTTKYFVFDEPYLVKVSDFFDTKQENPVVTISMV